MINRLAQAIHENAKSKGFYEGEKNTGEMLALIHSEVSEALEADRKGHYAKKDFIGWANYSSDTSYENHIKKAKESFEKTIKNSFEDELADIIIRVLDLAAYKGIDIETHISLKMRYNSTREFKHGKKY